VPDFAELEAANEAYVASGAHRHLDVRPGRQLVVVTCMDARIDVYAALGLELGDVHVLRTAGGRVTEDVLRSLTLSTYLLGTYQVAVITHTDCGLNDPDGTLGQRVDELVGNPHDPGHWLAFADPVRAARDDAQRLLDWEDRPNGLVVAAYVLDVETGALERAMPATEAPPRG
jgi:carbonic anhydrase